MLPIHNISGIILAGGSSERVGRPKANLRYDDGSTLLARQVEMLACGGIKKIAVVVGAHTAQIRGANASLGVEWIENPDWQLGQFASIQTGIKSAIENGASGVLILPVDTVGVAADIVSAIVETALLNPHLNAIIPEHEGRRGHPVFLSAGFGRAILELDPRDPRSRLDLLLFKEQKKLLLPVSDPNIMNNVNTMEGWERIRHDFDGLVQRGH